MKLRKRYFLLIFLAILPFYKIITFDDYCFGIRDLIVIGFFSVIFLIAFIATVFYNLYQINIQVERFNFRPLIIFGVFAISLFIGIQFKGKHILKSKVHTFKINDSSKGAAEIILYDNASFEFKTLHKEFDCVKKGTYIFTKDSLYLKRNNIDSKENLMDSLYYYNKSKRTLVPNNRKFPNFTN
ncbi:MAG: hypothetical protein WAO74_10125 [Polaribacter sp.]|uniref:hypothetical protein n=1 Tax=Polaribacter sp. TaxID=1920175 RepID=UPI003BAF3F13